MNPSSHFIIEDKKQLNFGQSVKYYQHSGSVRSSAAAAGLRFAQHGGRYGRGAGVARWCR